MTSQISEPFWRLSISSTLSCTLQKQEDDGCSHVFLILIHFDPSEDLPLDLLTTLSCLVFFASLPTTVLLFLQMSSCSNLWSCTFPKLCKENTDFLQSGLELRPFFTLREAIGDSAIFLFASCNLQSQ